MKRTNVERARGKYTSVVWSLVMLSSVIGLASVANRHPQNEGTDFLLAFAFGMLFTTGLSFVIFMPYMLKSHRTTTSPQQEDETT